MSEAITPDPLPPAVLPDAPVREPLPTTVFPAAHPGFWSGLGWSFVLSIVPQLLGGIAVGVFLVVYLIVSQKMNDPALGAGNPLDILDDPVVSYGFAGGIWLGHSLMIVAALIALRVVVGRDWARQVAIRLPAWWQAVVIVLIGPAVQVCAASVVHVLQLVGVPSAKELAKAIAFLAAVIGTLAVFGVASLLLYRPKPRKPGTTDPISGLLALLRVAVPFLVMAGLGYVILGDYAVRRFPDLKPGMDMQGMEQMLQGWPFWLGLVVIAVMPALSEELLCRAFLGRGLVGLHGPILGVALTSFLFGLIHLDPLQGTMALVLGLLIHFTYLTTRSLLIPMLLHFMNNGLAVTAGKVKELRDLATTLDAPQEGGLLRPEVTLLFATAWAVVLAAGLVLYFGRTRLVTPRSETPWEPEFEGVAVPPASSFTVAKTPAPPWWAAALLMAALGAFAVAVAAAIGVLPHMEG